MAILLVVFSVFCIQGVAAPKPADVRDCPLGEVSTARQVTNSLLRIQKGEAEDHDWAMLHGLAYRAARSKGLKEDEAQEVAQQTMIRVMGAVERFQEQGGAGGGTAWIATISGRLALNYKRTKSRKGASSLDDLVEGQNEAPSSRLPDTRGEAPDARLDKGEREAALHAAIAKLGAAQRTAILLQLKGKSYEEIAQEMGKRPKAIKSLLSRARDNLREELGDLGPNPE